MVDDHSLQDVRTRLELIADLKREYYIGTQSAWSYIKVLDEYGGLALRVATKLKEQGINRWPTFRPLSNICNTAYNLVSDLFGSLNNDHYDDDGWIDLEVSHFSKTYEKQFAASEIDDEDDKPEIRMLTFDYEQLATDILAAESKGKNISEGYEVAIEHMLEGRVTYLADLDGTRRSITKLVPRAHLKKWKEEKTGEILDVGNLLFRAATFHNFQYNPAADADFFQLEDPERVTAEELEYLHGYSGDDAYRRARQELNWNHLDTQRRIARNSIDTICPDASSPGEDRIEETLAHLVRKKEEIQHFLKGEKSDKMAQKYEDALVQIDYRMRTIISNEAWLKRILA